MFLLVVLPGAPNDAGFLLVDALKALLGYPDLQKYILSGAIKFVSVRSSSGNLSLRNYKGFNILFPKNLDAI